MAKWSEVANLLDDEYVTKKEYNELLKKYQELQATVSCDYYEAYLLEKAKREKLEKQSNETVPGYEYYE